MNTRSLKTCTALLPLMLFAACVADGTSPDPTSGTPSPSPSTSPSPPPASPPPSPPPSPSPSPTQDVTAQGEALGESVTQTLGPAGGTLTSADGNFVLTVPAGALPSDVSFTVQAVTHTLSGGVGTAYLLSAGPTRLALPLQATLKLPADEQAGTATPGIALQDDKGAWFAVSEAAFTAAPAASRVRGTAAATDLSATFPIGGAGTDLAATTTFGAYAGTYAEPRPATVLFGSELTLVLKSCVRSTVPPGTGTGGHPALVCAPLDRLATTVFLTAGTATQPKPGKVIYDPPLPPTPPVPTTETVKVTYGEPDAREVSIEVGVLDVAPSAIKGTVNFKGRFGHDTTNPVGMDGSVVLNWFLSRAPGTTIPGDVAVYTGSGTASWTETLVDCDPLRVSATVTAQMNVWDSQSPNTALAGRYAFSFSTAGNAPTATFLCGSPREKIELPVQLLVRAPCVDALFAQAPKYLNVAKLAGKGTYKCATSGGGSNIGQDMTVDWNFIGRP